MSLFYPDIVAKSNGLQLCLESGGEVYKQVIGAESHELQRISNMGAECGHCMLCLS